MKLLQNFSARVGSGLSRCGALAIFSFLLAGCASITDPDHVSGPSYQPSNAHMRQVTLPAEIRRVAVLPMTAAVGDSELEAGRDALEPILWAELARGKRFELQAVSRSQMQLWSGKAAWTAEEKLPASLLARIKEELACDAMLFSQITSYRAYPPMAVGWRLKLIDGSQDPILWAVDEYFDAGVPAVANAARRFQQQEGRNQSPMNDSTSILASPRRFGQYSLTALLGTLPAR
jgi:hypothetical protein